MLFRNGYLGRKTRDNIIQLFKMRNAQYNLIINVRFLGFI